MEKVTYNLKWTLELGSNREFKIALGHEGTRLVASVTKSPDGTFRAYTYGPYTHVGTFSSMLAGMKHFGFSTEVKTEEIAQAMVELGFAAANTKVGA